MRGITEMAGCLMPLRWLVHGVDAMVDDPILVRRDVGLVVSWLLLSLRIILLARYRG